MELLNSDNHKKIGLSILLALIVSTAVGTFSVLPPSIMPFLMAMVFLPFLFVIPVSWFMLLIALFIFIDRSFVTVGGSYIRLYQLLFLALVMKFVFELAFHQRQLYKAPLFLLINLWLLSYFASYPHVISYSDFWTVVVGQLFLNGFFYVTVQVVYSRGASFFQEVVKYTAMSGFIVAAVGILQWIGFFFGIHIGLSHYEVIGIPRPASFAHEPDWYGLFCGYTALWFLVLLLVENTKLFTRRFSSIGFAVCLIGVFLSMARASILSVIVSIFVLFLITKNFRLIKMGLAGLLLMGMMIAGLFVVDKEIATSIYERFNPATSMETDSGAGDSRVAAIQMMLDFIPQHWITGNGSGGMAALSQMQEMRDKYIYGGELNAGKGNANIFLTLMFDTGIIGTAIFTFLLIKIGVILKRTFSKVSYLSLGFISSSVFILVDFNFNNGFRMGFVWFHLALLAVFYMLWKKGKFAGEDLKE